MHKTFGDNFKLPLKTSGNKNAFSFSREDRFQPAAQFACKTSYYSNIDPKHTRSTSFGLGQRSSMINTQRCPTPGAYDPQSQSKLKKGFSFSHNKRVSFVEEHTKCLFDNPSPTNYQKAVFGKSCTFSFRSKYQDPLEKHKNKLGPGQYNLGGLTNQKGNYYQSKYRGSGCGKIGKQLRFQQIKTVAPGPGKYKDTLGIDPVGNYFNSRIQSKGIRTFGKPIPQSLFAISHTPGPGTYYNYQNFGSYLSR